MNRQVKRMKLVAVSFGMPESVLYLPLHHVDFTWLCDCIGVLCVESTGAGRAHLTCLMLHVPELLPTTEHKLGKMGPDTWNLCDRWLSRTSSITC